MPSDESFPGADPQYGMAILTTILVILLILFLLGAIPAGRRSRGAGFGLGGAATIVLIVLLILWLT